MGSQLLSIAVEMARLLVTASIPLPISCQGLHERLVPNTTLLGVEKRKRSRAAKDGTLFSK